MKHKKHWSLQEISWKVKNINAKYQGSLIRMFSNAILDIRGRFVFVPNLFAFVYLSCCIFKYFFFHLRIEQEYVRAREFPCAYWWYNDKEHFVSYFFLLLNPLQFYFFHFFTLMLFFFLESMSIFMKAKHNTMQIEKERVCHKNLIMMISSITMNDCENLILCCCCEHITNRIHHFFYKTKKKGEEDIISVLSREYLTQLIKLSDKKRIFTFVDVSSVLVDKFHYKLNNIRLSFFLWETNLYELIMRWPFFPI